MTDHDGSRSGASWRAGAVAMLLQALAFWVALGCAIVTIAGLGDLGAAVGGSAWPLAVVLVIGTVFCGWEFARAARRGLAGRLVATSLAPVRLMTCSAGLVWLVYTAFWQPFLESTAIVAVGLWAVLFSALTAVGRRIRPTAVLRWVDFVAFNLCLAVLAIELGLEVAGSLRPSVLLERADATVEQRLAQGRDRDPIRYGFPLNSGGHYDDEFTPREPGTPLVVAIGDSFSASEVPHYHHFTTVAERALPGVRIDNMGLSTIGPQEYLHLLVDEALPLDPDLVVVNLFVGNDLTQDVPNPGIGLGRWLDRDNLLIVQVPRRLAILDQERRGLDGALAGNPAERYRPVLARTPEEISELFPWVDDQELEDPRMTHERFMAVELRRAERLNSQPAEAYQRVFDCLARMRRAAGATPVLFMVIPDRFQVEDDLWRELRARTDLPLRRNHGPRLLRQWLDERQVEALDLLPYLRRAMDRHPGQRLYHRNDTHFNTAGNLVAGQALARFLEPRLAARARTIGAGRTDHD